MCIKKFIALSLAVGLILCLVGCDLPQNISLGISSYSGTASVEDPSSGTTVSGPADSTSSASSDISNNSSSENPATTTSGNGGNSANNNNNNNNNTTTTSSGSGQGDQEQGGQNQGSQNQGSQEQGGGSYTAIGEDSRYCYTTANLSGKQKALYLNVRNAVKSKTASLSLSTAAGISTDDVRLVVQCVNTDFPEYYWMTGSYSLHYSGNTATQIDFQYLPFNDSYTAAMEKAVEKFCDSLPANLSDYELELRAHDYLCKNVNYGGSNSYAHTAYGALVSKTCVCEGYARAMQLLMNRVGVQCSLVRGDAGGDGHMWNVIKIHGKWYHLDVTWDDPVGASTYNHFFFNLTTAQITAWDHTIDPGFAAGSEKGFNTTLPNCTGTDSNYFVKSNTLLNGSNDDAIATAALKAAKKSGKKSCEFRATADSAYHGLQKSQDKLNAFSNNVWAAGIGSFSIITSKSPDCFMITWQ